MRLPPGFLLFLTLAALMVVNAVRAFRGAAGSAEDSRAVGPAPLINGVVSLLAAVALVAAGYYMLGF